MVAAEQDFGDFPTLVFGGAGVVGVVEQVGREGILLGGLLVAQHAGDETHYGICDHEGGENSAGQDIIPDGNFIIDEVVGDALVDAFVVTAEKNEICFLGKIAGEGV